MNMKSKMRYGLMLLIGLWTTVSVISSCSDEPDKSNFYTFKGQMISDYLLGNQDFSEFSRILERAGMMKQMSAYGAYTCFAPTNEAIERYLSRKGISSVNDLSLEDCDTIARTHLISNMYATSDMNTGVISTPNMNRRYIEVTHGLDKDSNAVVMLNRTSHIIFELQDDSVENGIMQPVSEVLENSNRMLPDIMEENKRISLFSEALQATGLAAMMRNTYRDASYDPAKYPRYKYTSHVNKETATAPDTKEYGFTAFVPTDSILANKYGIHSLQDLYRKACEIYDVMYPEDVDKEGHRFENLSDSVNPLRRFIEYHIMDRKIQGWNYLTPLNDIGIMTTLMNPVDWYETLLPHTMLKIEKLTMLKYADADPMRERYINRRRDDEYRIRGALIQKNVENEYSNQAINGWYFYVDDILAFDETTRDIVDNSRIRMDFSTIFPELETNGIRQNGNVKQQDPEYDETGKYGRNYYFPSGYLKGVRKCTGYFVYRRPHDYYDSYEGDEFNLFGNFDIEFKIPPVPYEGDWQIRLGYAAEFSRGIAQIYFDGKPQGIPLDMTKDLTDASLLGAEWVQDYSSMSDAEKSADYKNLKNKGYYRGAMGGYRYDGAGASTFRQFVTVQMTLRRVLCTVHIDPKEDHYLRIRCVSTGQTEFDLDYLELVPKSVYGVSDGSSMEDPL